MPQAFPPVQWPDGRRVAVSLSFDDARLSQIDAGLPILDRHRVRATFYVLPGPVDNRINDWKRAVATGHEIGNHTLSHPCTGNFAWTRGNALEDFTLEKMDAELAEANAAIHARLGVTPQTFAYPCGQTFVGRGAQLASYIPLVARRFLAGRGYRDEAHNAADFCDLAKVGAFDLDSTPLDALLQRIDAARADGGWVIFAGHDVGPAGRQTVHADALDALCRYCRDEKNGVWIDTVANVARHLQSARR